jgi:chaperonin cofactor prefoldin
MPFLPCILCGKQLEQRTDKNGKFYFTCDPCGTQFFIRRKQGIEKLEELIRNLNDRELSIQQNMQSLFEIQAILSEIDGLKSEIEKLNGQIGILFVDEDKVQARNLLKTRIQGLLTKLEKIAKQSSEMK